MWVFHFVFPKALYQVSMTLHLIKLSVGSQSVEALADWVKLRVASNKKSGFGALHSHVTRMHPRREAELLEGGSIYWVIKGVVLCRQKLVRIDRQIGEDGVTRSALMMEPKLIHTQPQMRRAFQGWRYLKEEDAPLDINDGQNQAIPPELHMELAQLGLL